MLIRFSVENFRSFNGEAIFSMLPGRMQKHNEHIIALSNNIQALRVGLIYGANASGKTNLVRAMDFAKDFVVDGTKPKQSIPFEPFRLEKTNMGQPSRFEFEFMAKKRIYAYGFSIDNKLVKEEWLFLINGENEIPLFERKTSNSNKVTASFSNSNSESDNQFLNFIIKATRPNQLLLTTLADNNANDFEPVYEWFRNTLAIIFPYSHAHSIQVGVHKDQKFSQELASFLNTMNTGIDEVCTKPVDPDSLDFPMELILEDLEEYEGEQNNDIDGIMVVNGPDGRFLIHRNTNGEIEAHTLGTRRYIDKKPIDFDLFEESDGTQRLFDLFPVLYGTRERVFVIDELERSLHPNLVRTFIEKFLQTDNPTQLIVTTHESTLLDLSLLRRDEIWFVEKSPSGASNVYSLEDFKPRHDLDIRKGYLQGRFGAIPVFGSTLDLSFVGE